MAEAKAAGLAGQPSAPEPTREPAGYQVIVPDGWVSIELVPGRMERSVARLVDQQFAGIDNAPHLKAQARQELLKRADAARHAGGVEMFLSMMRIEGLPIAASLTMYVVPAGGALSPDDLAPEMAGDGDKVTVVDLPAGRAVRIVRDAALPEAWASGAAPAGPDRDELTQALLSREVQVFLPVPGGTGTWLLLVFAAPLGPLAPSMTNLFDAICQTLRWR